MPNPKNMIFDFLLEKSCPGWGLMGASPWPGLQEAPTDVAHPEGARSGQAFLGEQAEREGVCCLPLPCRRLMIRAVFSPREDPGPALQRDTPTRQG